MERKGLAAPHSKSIFETGQSSIDSSQLQLTILSFANEWYFKPEGVELVKKRFGVELEKLERSVPFESQIYIQWNSQDSMWRVRCAKTDYRRVWSTFLTVSYGVIREAIRGSNQCDAKEDYKAVTDDEDADEDYDFSQDTPLESNLVQRLAVWKMESVLGGPVMKVNTDDQVAGTHTDFPPVVQNDSFPKEIRYYKFRQAWECSDKSIMLDDLLPEDDLEELVRLTSCQFSKYINDGIVFVGAHEKENLRLAVQKLNNIEKNWQYRNPWVNHLFYTEEIAKAKHALVYFVDMKWFYFESTLLDNLQVTFSNGACDYETLINAVTVRCCPYLPINSSYVPLPKSKISKISVEQIPGGVRVFLNALAYNSKGDASENPMLHRPTQVPDQAPFPHAQSNVQQLQNALAPHLQYKDESVQRWATEVPDPISSGVVPAPNGLPDGVHRQSNGVVVNANGQANSNRPAWDTYKEYSPEKTATIVEGELSWRPHPGAFGVTSRASALQRPPVLGSYLNGQASNGTARQGRSAMERSASMPQVTLSSDDLARPLGPTIHHQQPLQQNFGLRPQVSQTAARNQDTRRHCRSVSQADAIPVPAMPTTMPTFSTSMARRNNAQLSLLDEDDPALQNLNFDLLDPNYRAPGSQDQIEQEQPVSESETRQFHQTMNQRAPKPYHYVNRIERPFSPHKSAASSQSEKKLVDPLPGFVEEINRDFKELLAGLRSYRGKAVVQVEFGRIILGRFHPKHLTQKDDPPHVLDGPILQSLIIRPTEYGPTADFTSVLTTVPAEIQYMVNMKGRDGQNLWQANKNPNWYVTYDFMFTDTQDPLYPVMIEINAESFVAQIKTRCRLGNMFIHGTMRHWDLKVGAIGYGKDRALEEKYGDLATDLQASLFIPPNSYQPYLSWKLDNSLQERFIIEDVTVRRVYEYKSTDEDSVLKVSELKSLNIDGGPAKNQLFWIFEAQPSDSDKPLMEKLTTWYEASITSVKLDEVLIQNESLDLGDETAWTLEDVADMKASKALLSPALEMLKQMDGVGQTDRNGSDYRSRKQADHSMQLQAPDPVVWW